METAAEKIKYLDKFTARKVQDDTRHLLATLPDSLDAWITQYLHLAVIGVRSPAVTQKIALHLARFLEYFQAAYGHDRISTCLKRDVVSWQKQMQTEGLAHSTINNHMASLSSFCTWVHSHTPQLFATGDPTKGVGELGLPPLEPRALNEDQVRSLKNLCDRLERFHLRKGRRHTGTTILHGGRQWWGQHYRLHLDRASSLHTLCPFLLSLNNIQRRPDRGAKVTFTIPILSQKRSKVQLFSHTEREIESC